MGFIEHHDASKTFKGYAYISDRPDRHAAIAFSNDFGNTWHVHSAWIIPDEEAEKFNEDHYDPENSPFPPYVKRDSWVFGNCYWEDSFSFGTPEMSKKLEELELAGDLMAIHQYLKECLEASFENRRVS